MSGAGARGYSLCATDETKVSGRTNVPNGFGIELNSTGRHRWIGAYRRSDRRGISADPNRPERVSGDHVVRVSESQSIYCIALAVVVRRAVIWRSWIRSPAVLAAGVFRPRGR